MACVSSTRVRCAPMWLEERYERYEAHIEEKKVCSVCIES